MKKRLLAILLTLCMTLTMLPLTAVAYSSTDLVYPVEGGNLYFDKATGTITDCDSTVTGADIPAEIDGVAVTSIGYHAFYWCTSLTSVTIPSSVTSIGASAFSWCSSLTSVTIPESVTSIGNSAFSGCTSLTAIQVAEGNTVYASEDGVLFDKQKTVLYCYPAGKTGGYELPEGVTSIGNSAFSGCASLTSVTIPDSVTSIGASAFSGCASLTSVTIPDSVTSIGASAFSGCASLTSVTIPDSVTSIGDDAFHGCSSLTGVTIPSSVMSIGNGAFGWCTSLTSVTISEGATSIGASAFSWCSSLTSVTIPESVTSIGNSAFSGCTSLTNVTIPNGVTSIGDRAFCNCTSLTSACFMGDAPVLGDCAFQMRDEETREYINIPGLTLYYIDGKANWTTPTWNGYPTATWLPHEHTYTETVTAPTCTEQGYTTHTCSICGDSYVDSYVDALGHDLGEWSETKAATCTEKGEERRDCSRCEYYETREVEALGHDYKDTVTDPTCTEQGYTTHICTRCEDSYVDTYVNALGHNYKDGVCTVCGAKDPDYKPSEPDTQPADAFTDVSKSQWYYNSVNFAVANNLFLGTSDTTFSPNASMTRAMLVTVLWRLDGRPEAGTQTAFRDVPESEYYAQPVAWASANGIVMGTSTTTFSPNGKITREQMAAILFRYAQQKGYDTSRRAELSKFPDNGKVSDYAKEALAWANAEGLINGDEQANGTVLLDPAGNATRAQVAAILMRYVENIVK